MKSRTEKILAVLRVLAWMAMIGYAINLGSQVFSFAVSFFNPVAAKQIPGIGQNLENLMYYDFGWYVCAMSFVMVISTMLVYLWLVVIRLLTKLNMQSPFTFEVVEKLEKIAYWLFAIWVVGVLGENYTQWISKRMGQQLNIVNAVNEYLFTAGIIYIISQIFRHGVEMQEENQQTI